MSGRDENGGDTPLSETFSDTNGAVFEEEVALEGNLNATAKALMALEADRLASENEQIQKRKAIRGNLAASDVPVPTNDMGMNAGRDLAQEYQDRMGDWQRETETIEAHFETTRTEIREDGSTLFDHWEDHAYYEVTSPEVEQEMPWEMRAAFDEAIDKDFLLDEDHADGLNFEAPEQGHDGGHDQDGGRSR